MSRPFTFINVAVTADGKIDTFERRGAAISSKQDKQRVDRLRAGADAVMVGGHTLLQEDPALTVKSEALRAERVASGLPPNPLKVGVVTRANLDPAGDFLTAGPASVVIFTTAQTSNDQLELLRSSGAGVYILGDSQVNLLGALETLYGMGIRRLMVEGGGTLNFELLRLGLVDELTLYVAPLVFGGLSAPTLAAGSGFVRDQALSLDLVDLEKWEDGGVLLHYKPKTSQNPVK
jgi:2,5-diamino-6-(ribosylamino)-4(3H)-pyrimidinone 5'-phosphate reductase